MDATEPVPSLGDPSKPENSHNDASHHPANSSWSGVVVARSELPPHVAAGLSPNEIVIRVKRPATDSTKVALSGIMKAHVSFHSEDEDEAHKAKVQAVQDVLWGNTERNIPSNNKLQPWILGHDNHVRQFMPVDAELGPTARAFFDSLGSSRNGSQKNAIRQSICERGNYLVLIKGPPGTGKTAVSTSIIRFCYENNIKILVACGSNQGLDVVARKFQSECHDAYPEFPIHGVYRLKTEFFESAAWCVSRSQGSDTADHRVPNDSLNLPADLIAEIKHSTDQIEASIEEFSLPKHINDRVSEYAQNNLIVADEERGLLSDFVKFKTSVEDTELNQDPDTASTQSGEPLTDHDNAGRLEELWCNLRRYYLCHAKVVFCTATTAAREVLRGFGAEYVLIEEAPSVTETTCLVPLAAFLGTCKKIILSGDVAQLAPILLSRGRNESFSSLELSLFERMIKSGCQDVELKMQYRMTRQISDLVSNMFYKGRIQTHRSCENRPLSTQLSEYFSQHYEVPEGTTSVFASVSGSTVLNRMNDTSLINPHYVSFIYKLVDDLLRRVPGIMPQDILIISYYNQECKGLSYLFRNSIWYQVRVNSVYSAQGAESPVVILSTTRPGIKFGLGLLRNRNRCNVALSRAREFQIVVGHKSMAVCELPKRNPWKEVVHFHLDRSSLIEVEGNDSIAREKLQIFEGAPGYEVLQVQPLRQGDWALLEKQIDEEVQRDEEVAFCESRLTVI